MSWMDSWSRPSKHAATPPPLYLTVGGEATIYCHTCGRVITPRKSSATNTLKYCSDRCRQHRPKAMDRYIERVFKALLEGEEVPSLPSSEDQPSSQKPAIESIQKPKKRVKGDSRVTIDCSTVETMVFGPRNDPTKVYGRRKNRASRALGKEGAEWKSVDMVSTEDSATASDSEAEAMSAATRGISIKDDQQDEPAPNNGPKAFYRGAGTVRPSQMDADVNASVGGEKGWAERLDETPEMLDKRKEGMRRVEEKEMVKRAARRGCAFGFEVDADDAGDREEHAKSKAKKGKKKGAKGKGVSSDDDTDNDREGGVALEGKGKASKGEKPLARRKCEAVINGVAVEASFAKGDWGIRWRES